MTDKEITELINNVWTVLDFWDTSQNERVRYTWASCAVKWFQEIADEMERRIGKDVSK